MTTPNVDLNSGPKGDTLMGAKVQLIENHANHFIVRNALCIGMTMHESLLGARGEPGIDLVVVDSSSNSGRSADWNKALIRMGDVVHATHKDWVEGRTTRCYELVNDTLPLAPADFPEIAAQAAHEANRIFCGMFGDWTHQTWADTPEDLRESVRTGIRMIAHEPGIAPQEQHNSWVKYKLAQGWTYGETRDVEKKTHPALLPYEELPVQQQLKDWMFGTIARSVLGLTQIPAQGNMPPIPLQPRDTFPVPLSDLNLLAEQISNRDPEMEICPDAIVPNAASLLHSMAADIAHLVATDTAGQSQPAPDGEPEAVSGTGTEAVSGAEPESGTDGSSPAIEQEPELAGTR